jgi:hypothetical protein
MINNEKEIPLIKLQHLFPYSTFLEYGCYVEDIFTVTV